jgi:hypothetical protein
MEIIIAIIFVVIVALIFFSRKPKELVQAEQAEVAPYKVETAEVAPAPVVEEAKAEEVPAKKPRAPRKPKAETAKAPAVKKPRAPRKPKAN